MFWLISLLILCVNASKVDYYESILKENLNNAQYWNRPSFTHNFEADASAACEDFGLYDFVIVGGGSAGAVLAARLSEIKNWQILLLEAGGQESDYTLMPGIYIATHLSDVNWGYLTTPQNHACLEMTDRRCDFTRGKLMGGCSAINAMTHFRGNKKDFDAWQPGWSYHDVVPYFIKLENASGFAGDAGYHGTTGPIGISRQSARPEIMDVVVDAIRELGNSKVVDYNGAEQVGVADIQSAVSGGVRQSSNHAYLRPIMARRKNLHIITEALVTRVNFANKAVTDVQFIQRNVCYRARVNKEAILSAGAVNSPQLLMLSGIGPKEELDRLQIQTMANLPVGKYLEDHPVLFLIPISTNASTRKLNLREEVEKYVKGQGEIAHFYPVLDFLAFDGGDYPDTLAMLHRPNQFYTLEVIKNVMNFDDEQMEITKRISPGDLIMHILLLHPKSKGRITLKSKDPLDFPYIDPNYLQHPDDVENLYIALQHYFSLEQTDAFTSINAKFQFSSVKACRGLRNRDFWHCVIRHKTSGLFHPIGTCKMGNSTGNSVVDEHLKVHGIQKLRVVDASVVPQSTSGPPNAVVLMLAEKAADIIKKLHI